MKTIIAGSRGISDIKYIRQAVEESGFQITKVVSGRARGVDRLGERYADEIGAPKKYFPAAWTTYGKKAGHLRNVEMADYADALIAIWDGESSGTEDMIQLAKNRGLKVYVKIVKEDDLSSALSL